MGSVKSSYERSTNPIDLIEQLAAAHGWACDRGHDDELTLVVVGGWTDYQVSLNWRGDLEALHLACAFDFKVPDYRVGEMYRLLGQYDSAYVYIQQGLKLNPRYPNGYEILELIKTGLAEQINPSGTRD